jgi:hypothetical protein
MSDKLVFDLAQEIEGSPNIFIRKDWLNILDNQAQNYNGNQSVIDTSQLSNSNKWMNYREAYLSVPLLITLGTVAPPVPAGLNAIPGLFTPATITNFPQQNPSNLLQSTSAYSIGLKNWYGSIIHSFTLDYNGTTIIQQTPFINLWNTFKLMTSLSWADVQTQGTVIGFYPDTATTLTFTPVPFNGVVANPAVDCIDGPNEIILNGQGTCNNSVKPTFNSLLNVTNNNFDTTMSNIGLYKRIQNINFDPDGLTGGYLSSFNTQKYAQFINNGVSNNGGAAAAGSLNLLWKNYIFNKVNQTAGNVQAGIVQYNIVATIYLKHIHSFFNMVPLLKGTFMKMTLNLNNTSTAFTTSNSTNGTAGNALLGLPNSLVCTSVTNPFGGNNPIMIASAAPLSIAPYPVPVAYNTPESIMATSIFDTGSSLFAPVRNATVGGGGAGAASSQTQNYVVNLSIGATCLNSQLASLQGIERGILSQSVYLYVPSYTFNSPFEQAYLSQSVKTIKYTDVYQYQVLNVASGSQFNSLITNGISNIKSVLILPFYSSSGSITPVNYAGTQANLSTNSGFLTGLPVWQSPFDPAGGGPTSPLCYLSNFNIQIAGQNAIYNTQVRNFEQFNNQLYGCNAVNGGLTDGLTSGLVGRQEFDMEYCYYYVNVERMLPVEETVPKSVSIQGTNLSSKLVDLIVWVEYGNEIKIDPLTGARV